MNNRLLIASGFAEGLDEVVEEGLFCSVLNPNRSVSLTSRPPTDSLRFSIIRSKMALGLPVYVKSKCYPRTHELLQFFGRYLASPSERWGNEYVECCASSAVREPRDFRRLRLN
jgi:hypothetical protein